jgi:hypothetical protein
MVHQPEEREAPTSASQTCLHFHYAQRFATLALAYMLDSLVRVSRRVGWVHFVSILSAYVDASPLASDTTRNSTCAA